MSSIQERLQLKRVPLDTWNIREQLCLASAVVRSGDQNWMSVSRSLKTIGEPNRPVDWYSQKSCAAQYGALLEHVETPKRKKRSSEGAVETPQESILKRLTQERIVEIQKNLAEMNQQYEQLTNIISEAQNPVTSEDRLQEIWSSIEASKRARERETARRAAWLKEREERRARAERTWRPPQTPQTATPAPPASPLLTSLLKSSPVVTTPQHISHPANSIETISPSATAPTLSMLLEKNAPSGAAQHESKHAAIEHIKSQLVQIEQQLKASSSSPAPLAAAPAPAPAPAPALAPAVDIDDIEIKAEDVYAFRDIDIHIPPVATMHKGPVRTAEKPTVRKDDGDMEVATRAATDGEAVEVKEEPVSAETETEEVQVVEVETEQTPDEAPGQQSPEVKISFPEVKFPTPEIKVIQPDEQKIKEEVKEPEVPPTVPETTEEEVVEEDITVTVDDEPSVEEPLEEVQTVQEVEVTPAPEVADPEPEPEPEAVAPETIPLPEEPTPVVNEKISDAPLPEESPPPLLEPKEETQPEVQEEQIEEEKEKEIEEIKKEDDDDSMPLKEMIKEAVAPLQTDSQESRDVEHTDHTETDDDTPMELSREEEKGGRKKRDYSRKKKSDSRTCSGSESAPESPSASDAERQHRLWRKSVMLVYSRLCAHKYASLFLRPISDEEAPGYSVVVKRPMDLTTIRKNIDAGIIRTTAQFQRDVLLMLSNALMYNSSEHSVYTMAKQMQEEAACQLGMLLAAQAHAGLSAAPLARRKRRRDSPPPAAHAKRLHTA
ncbi:bromodomain-containing protein 8-like isoform X2 [Plodia interpunctella]|uniref:bromodomain-containing protein 8-like isoform X2 n=1 Tax=Plodia interpunctella TaxID=58824 RepID=UPI00236785CB|nr:bromodomain-containing protein 8-like isoform X2 [Plodia interpunctella]